jgi:hypothetical protein
MDALARGLRNAAALVEGKKLSNLVEERYASWKSKGGLGQKIIKGEVRGAKGGGLCIYVELYLMALLLALLQNCNHASVILCSFACY